MNRLVALIFFGLILFPLSGLAQDPNDAYYDEQWYLAQISAPTAWDYQTGSEEVIVAVLDSGVDLDHPDLVDNLWQNRGEIPDNGVDDDGNGFVDDVYGWDFVEEDNGPAPDVKENSSEDATSHGTLIAGLIGAVGNNEEGVAGVAWDVQIMPLRTLNDLGSGSSREVSRAINYAIQNGADVINLSFSGTSSDSVLRDAMRDAYDAGIIVVAALGNENTDVNTETVYPACYAEGDEDWVIGVAASNRLDSKASFSNYGSDCADLAAPGVDIFGLSYNDEANGYTLLYDGGWTGTSMSAPLVSGAAALLLSQHSWFSPEDVRIVLQLSVDPLSGAHRGDMGSGRLNISRALEVGEQYAAVNAPEGDDAEGASSADGVVESGEAFRGASFPSVYVADELDRHVFINEFAYFTYFDSFAGIESVADDDLPNYTLRGLVLPKAGTVLVKIQSDPRVYALQADANRPYRPKLREIITEEIAVDMYGEAWADYVIDIEPTFFAHFGKGTAITSPEAVNTSIMKTRAELAALAQLGS